MEIESVYHPLVEEVVLQLSKTAIVITIKI